MAQYRFESLWAYVIQYERNLSSSGGHASVVRGKMVKSIIICLFQMRDLKVFCNYWGLIYYFFAQNVIRDLKVFYGGAGGIRV